MCGHKVAGDIFEHGGLARVHAGMVENVIVSLPERLGRKPHGADVPDVLEEIGQAGAGQDPLRMMAATIGEDEAPARQGGDGFAQTCVGLDGGKVDVVDVEQEFFGIGIVQLDEAGERGAVVAVIGFLDAAGFFGIHPQQALDIGLHAGVDLGEKIGIGPVERVVEIENPVADMAEIGLGGRGVGGLHGGGRWWIGSSPASQVRW